MGPRYARDILQNKNFKHFLFRKFVYDMLIEILTDKKVRISFSELNVIYVLKKQNNRAC